MASCLAGFISLLAVCQLNAGCFTQEQLLRRLVSSARSSRHVDWESVAGHFSDKSIAECQQRWHKLTHPDMVKGGWTQQVREM